MARWLDRLPSRNWRKWGVAYVAHAATGFFSSSGSIISLDQGLIYLTPAFIQLSLLVCWRQYVEFLRRNDTPGRDLGDHIIGFGAGIAAGMLVSSLI